MWKNKIPVSMKQKGFFRRINEKQGIKASQEKKERNQSEDNINNWGFRPYIVRKNNTSLHFP